MSYNFRALEDNGGGLHIIVTDDDNIVYAASGFEGEVGSLSHAIMSLQEGDIDAWDGNILRDGEILAELRRENGGEVYDENGDVIPMTEAELEAHFGLCQTGGAEVVADADGIYWGRMGVAARKDFGQLTLAQIAGLYENITISS